MAMDTRDRLDPLDKLRVDPRNNKVEEDPRALDGSLPPPVEHLLSEWGSFFPNNSR